VHQVPVKTRRSHLDFELRKTGCRIFRNPSSVKINQFAALDHERAYTDRMSLRSLA
jgi:hypothetical protein